MAFLSPATIVEMFAFIFDRPLTKHVAAPGRLMQGTTSFPPILIVTRAMCPRWAFTNETALSYWDPPGAQVEPLIIDSVVSPEQDMSMSRRPGADECEYRLATKYGKDRVPSHIPTESPSDR